MSIVSVSDIFCGAGGFSEGFRQKGFDVAFALDNWQPAIDTHSFNHKKTFHLKISVLDLDIKQIKSIIPDTTVIIGSPPCTYFSKSNKGGKGDFSMGIKLVKKFLQIIAIKKPKFWVLENVLPLMNHIKDKYSYDELGLDGGDRTALHVPRKMMVDASDFGVPQRRKRLFCGNFPFKEPNKKNLVTLGDVINSLPSPISSPRFDSLISDINYKFKIKEGDLTDHFYDTRISEYHWTEAKRLKQDHSYYGKMSFPEDFNKPSRTIMATNNVRSRESLIFIDKNSTKCFRTPTIREIATIQSYPISYQFLGNSEDTKYALVGNSVPPKVSAAIAEAILKELKMPIKSRINPNKSNIENKTNINGMKLKRRSMGNKPISSRFRMHVPELKSNGFRVDLDNLSSHYDAERFIWKASLHHGTGKDSAKRCDGKINDIIYLLKETKNVPTCRFIEAVKNAFSGKIPSSAEFQLINCRILKDNNKLGPYEALHVTKRLIDKYFPKSLYENVFVDNSKGILKIDRKFIPLRIIAALYSCKYVENLTDSD